HIHLLTGRVVLVTEMIVEVVSDKALRVPRLACSGVTADIEDFGRGFGSGGGGHGNGGGDGCPRPGDCFRLDKDEMSTGTSTLRSNVLRLMIGETPEAKVEGRQGNNGGKGGGKRGADGTGDSLNRDQQAAVRKVVAARDYALLLGMPGTGKTSTIAFVARALLARGASVLITSYTHSAVDNLLLKLREHGVPCLRVGATAQVHPALRDCCLDRVDAVAALAARVAGACVVGCTCLGIKHPVFSKRRFDYCIVDEAGQITQAAVLGPLRCADIFVLVGDHYQLPPLVTNPAAAASGMDVSLFRRLAEAHPGAIQELSIQYRMNADITHLCNALI
ncbi:unnamed protein product, partial [Phaeothamnion confervicola]